MADEAPLDFPTFVAREANAIHDRRELFGIAQDAPLVGLALSGGGIRSATFSLGFLQALSAKALLRRVDYLSTVSGGSYMGSFLGALFVPPANRSGFALAERPEFDRQRPLQSPLGLEAVRRLRDAGRYLTPAGTSDAFYGAATVMRNWAAVQLVIGMAALLGFWTLHAIDYFVRPLLDAPAFVSPSLAALTLVSALFVWASGSAYWLTRREWIPGPRWRRVATNGIFWSSILLIAYLTLPWWAPDLLRFMALPPSPIAAVLASGVSLAVLFYLIQETRWGNVQHSARDDGSTEARERRKADLSNPQLLIAAEDRVRTALSRQMATALTWLLIFAGLLAINAIAYFVPGALAAAFRPVRSFPDLMAALLNAWPAIVSVATPILSWIGHRKLKRQEAEAKAAMEGTRPGSWLPVLLVIAGAALVVSWLILWGALAYYLLALQWFGVWGLPVILAVLVFLNFMISISFSFINLSSLASFYAARLRRAYIGASSYGTRGIDIQKDDPQDTIGLDGYYTAGTRNGAPAHIINVTIAETVTGTSNLVARDRKGKPLQVTPAGIAHEGDHPGLMIGHNRRWGEELPLASWVAASGAAVSAAIGSGTSLGTSILATMTNMRLGYWWKRKRSRSTASLFWTNIADCVQNHLLLELRGAFHGTRRMRWYLTDGGHFENTGAYALLQREVPFVVVCDNGADPQYAMADVVRLVGRARTDLGAHISFLGREEINAKLGEGSPLAPHIGPYPELARLASADRPGAIATLANIDYASGNRGLLLLVKPRLTLSEPPELLAYRAQPGCAHFPQQTTGDQFFDEVQWEAYRRLGELAGEKLFAAPAAGATGWHPYTELTVTPASTPAKRPAARARGGKAA